ncbi:MAG: hypothetical protein DVB27_00725 [Verrucomicrobia bacterium]|nr:MAG: hypothetical protein DVB27_00725 [Verrucomicrobiota bacterium]
MPSNLRPILLAVAAGAAVLVVEETRMSALRKAPASPAPPGASAAPAAELAELAGLRERNAALAAESEQLRARLGDAADPAGTAGAKPAEKGSALAGLAKFFTDPEMKKLMRTQQSAGTRMMYGDLAKELGLSDEQADKVMNLLAARQAAAGELALNGVSGAKADPAKAAELADYDAKIKVLLGPEKSAKLNEYERTSGDRMAVRQYERSFTKAGLPLDETQSAGLFQIMKEERLKAPASPLEPGGKNPLAAMAALQDGAALEQALQTQRDLQQRVLARAHTVLSPDQMTAFESAQKQQLQMQEMGVKMGKAIFGGGK